MTLNWTTNVHAQTVNFAPPGWQGHGFEAGVLTKAQSPRATKGLLARYEIRITNLSDGRLVFAHTACLPCPTADNPHWDEFEKTCEHVRAEARECLQRPDLVFPTYRELLEAPVETPA